MPRKDLRKELVKNEAKKGRNREEIDAALRSQGYKPIDPDNFLDAKLLRMAEHRKMTRLEKCTERIFLETAKIAGHCGKPGIADRATLIAFLREHSFSVYDFLEDYRCPRRVKLLSFDLACGCTVLEAKRDLMDSVLDGFYRDSIDIALLRAFERNTFVGTPGGPAEYTSPQEVIDLAQKIRALTREARENAGAVKGSRTITLSGLLKILSEAEDENNMTVMNTMNFFQRVFPGFDEDLTPTHRSDEQFLSDVRRSADMIADIHERTRRELTKQIVKLIYADLIFGAAPYDLFFNKIEKGKKIKIEDLTPDSLRKALNFKVNLMELSRKLYSFLVTDTDLSNYLNNGDIIETDPKTVAKILRDCLSGSGDITRTFFICLLSFIQRKLSGYYEKTRSLSIDRAERFQRMLALLPPPERRNQLRLIFEGLPDADIDALAVLAALPSEITAANVRNALIDLKLRPVFDFSGFYSLLAQLNALREYDCIKWVLNRVGVSLTDAQAAWLDELNRFLCMHDASDPACQSTKKNLEGRQDMFAWIEDSLHACGQTIAEFSGSKSPFELLLKSIPDWERVVQEAFAHFFRGGPTSLFKGHGKIFDNEYEVNGILMKCGWVNLHVKSTEMDYAYDRVAHVVFCLNDIEDQIRSGELPDYMQTVWGNYLGEYNVAGTMLKIL